MNGSQHRLELRVLGDFQVTRDGQPLDLPPSRKTRALLAYLAVTARQHQRERLCEIFWDVPDDPRGALRWSLSKIRQVLGGGGPAGPGGSATLAILGPIEARLFHPSQRDDFHNGPLPRD